MLGRKTTRYVSYPASSLIFHKLLRSLETFIPKLSAASVSPEFPWMCKCALTDTSSALPHHPSPPLPPSRSTPALSTIACTASVSSGTSRSSHTSCSTADPSLRRPGLRRNGSISVMQRRRRQSSSSRPGGQKKPSRRLANVSTSPQRWPCNLSRCVPYRAHPPLEQRLTGRLLFWSRLSEPSRSLMLSRPTRPMLNSAFLNVSASSMAS